MTTVPAPTYTGLQDTEAFPPFSLCPDENDIPLTYYDMREDGVYSPIRHWCFLGEITLVTNLGRLGLWVKDKEDKSIRIAFHLDHDRPMFRVFKPDDPANLPNHPNIPHHLIEEGNAIAILYGQQHQFMDMSQGFRVETADGVHIFPCNLEKLLDLSDCILRGGVGLEGERACAKCGATSTAPQRCGACHITWYCGKECQISDWSDSDGGHKKDCKLAKQVALLMKQDWENFTSYYSFPLSKK